MLLWAIFCTLVEFLWNELCMGDYDYLPDIHVLCITLFFMLYLVSSDDETETFLKKF